MKLDIISTESGKSVTVRPAAAADAEALTGIYNHYVRESIATFHEEPLSPSEMSAQLRGVESAELPWLVAEADGKILGYAYAGKWKGRCAYRFSVEITAYLVPGYQGRGIGSKLYGCILGILRDKGIHSVIGGIALPNDASIALHEKFGFRKVAHFRETGFKFGRWVDVGYWQRTL